MRGKSRKDEQEHQHPGCKDEEATKINNAARGEDVAPGVVVAVALRVGVVKIIISFSHIHSESTGAPFSGIGRERKLAELEFQF